MSIEPPQPPPPQPRDFLLQHTPQLQRAQHLIVGGGLAGGLVALALANRGRGAGVVMIESDTRLGGNHTWSFHDTDLEPAARELVEPLVAHRWPRQVVVFPGHERTFDSGYATVTSDNFSDVLASRLRAAGVRLCLGRRVAAAGEFSVRLDDETVLRGETVIDARGPQPARDPGAIGAAGEGGGDTTTAYQKFVGLELQLRSDGPWTSPVLMDATVAQFDGYRFTYVLPFSARRVLIEDTVYSGDPMMDPIESAERVLAYAALHGARVDRVLRSEMGVLPLPLTIRKQPTTAGGPIAIGYRGGFFHPVTGYSLPLAARVALAIADAPTPRATRTALRAISRGLWGEQRFGLLLNRLMFQAMAPATRWTALARFYRLPESTIARFYASRTTWWDRARVLVGRPPAGMSWRHLLGAGFQPARMEEQS